jgi:hypothetical protein
VPPPPEREGKEGKEGKQRPVSDRKSSNRRMPAAPVPPGRVINAAGTLVIIESVYDVTAAVRLLHGGRELRS